MSNELNFCIDCENELTGEEDSENYPGRCNDCELLCTSCYSPAWVIDHIIDERDALLEKYRIRIFPEEVPPEDSGYVLMSYNNGEKWESWTHIEGDLWENTEGFEGVWKKALWTYPPDY